MKDPAGNTRAEAVGWLTGEPPNVLSTAVMSLNARRRSTRTSDRGRARTRGAVGRAARAGPPPELVVERLVGPFVASSEEPPPAAVDPAGSRRPRPIAERRLVIYDDASC
ncbi:MAG: hypothetical protein KF850_06830 [Labilithrix sp.]|nr:hypothetical protein [Labilithrix sp.]